MLWLYWSTGQHDFDSPDLYWLVLLLQLVFFDILYFPISSVWSLFQNVSSSFQCKVSLFFLLVVSTAGSRSSSPGKLLGHGTCGRVPRVPTAASSTAADKRSRIPRSQGCSRETSPSRLGLGKNKGHTNQNSVLVTLVFFCFGLGVFFWSRAHLFNFFCPPWKTVSQNALGFCFHQWC